MRKLALCDDVSVQLDMLEDIVKSYCSDTGLRTEIKSFPSGEALLADVDANGSFDVYILDMIMPGIKGIELGTALRDRGDKGKIIYLTATAEYAVDSYSVDAFFYLLKPIGRKKIYDVLDRARTQLLKENADSIMEDTGRCFEFKSRDGSKLIRLGDITYVNIVDRGLCYHLVNGDSIEGPMLRIPFHDAVEDIASEEGFELAGSHLLVNLKNIELADKNKVRFVGGEVIYPSKNACSAIYDILKV